MKGNHKNSISIISGNANPQLAKAICRKLGIHLDRVAIGRFPDGEIRVQIEENIRGKDLFIIQSICQSPNDHLMELLILIDAAKRASAQRITAVLPYYGYGRQDRKDRPRVPITAKLVANLLQTSGANRILTMDLHSNQIQGFFDIPFDHLYSINVLCPYLIQRKKKDREFVVASTDVGGIKMARAYANRLNCNLAIVDKRREDASTTHAMHIIGNVKDCDVVIVDDMVTTAGSLVEAVSAIKRAGAREIYAAIVHPVLVGPAISRLQKSGLKELVVTDTIPLPSEKRIRKIKVRSVAGLLAEAIHRIHQNQSVSSLFRSVSVES
ncbi:MAG: phosphoribosylpyrophosphate synthetase [Candidatus Omnitrophica bacterium CG11_big_fil_rev_8_21_14_0_20_45_26]|uniref:Ribose-phosphate pyrophosphokinase n=1 Tax=Candidatus Abzuiibacterium crystallinum TaxID=1974748 RepID=A0A2H0LSN1_9BACT|nr:MAG: phosphoribosylpyrophosphate synthetase [Candidatus Omnitrophica bacterium CG11_big_fil_rev_8_21_14_0_20_45_26]PIW63407.1 MAG: phosphoribosylpyrophosphate synthetase [Candidatus Omnitrophica bacterium CG12_big_fil_rev_8_21_14_0_65_45_16]